MAPLMPSALLSHTGLVKLDEASYPCYVSDMTLTGARLHLEDTIDLPSIFSLLLTRDGRVLRECSLIWQEDHNASVLFWRAWG